MTLYRHRVMGPGSAGDVWVSTMHSEGTADLTAAHAAWSVLVSAAFGFHLTAMWAATTQVSEIITDQLDPLTWTNVAQAVSALNLVGTSTAAAPSPRSCVVVGLRTALPTRAGRGRMYLPALSSAHMTNEGKFVGADCQTIANDFSGAINNMRATVTPVIAHRNTRTWTPINRVTVGDIPGTQRRRTNKDVNNYASNPV